MPKKTTAKKAAPKKSTSKKKSKKKTVDAVGCSYDKSIRIEQVDGQFVLSRYTNGGEKKKIAKNWEAAKDKASDLLGM